MKKLALCAYLLYGGVSCEIWLPQLFTVSEKVYHLLEHQSPHAAALTRTPHITHGHAAKRLAVSARTRVRPS